MNFLILMNLINPHHLYFKNILMSNENLLQIHLHLFFLLLFIINILVLHIHLYLLLLIFQKVFHIHLYINYLLLILLSNASKLGIKVYFLLLTRSSFDALFSFDISSKFVTRIIFFFHDSSNTKKLNKK